MPGDGRAHLLALSADGIERLSIAVPIVNEAHHVFFDAAHGTEQALKMLLARLFENFELAARSAEPAGDKP
jgi:hypothetical protein